MIATIATRMAGADVWTLPARLDADEMTETPTETRAGNPARGTGQRVGAPGAPGLMLRLALAPFAPAPPAPGKALVLVTVGIEVPGPPGPGPDVVTVTPSVTLAGALVGTFEPHEVTVPRGAAGEAPSEWTTLLDLAPGRYEVRLTAQSKLTNASGSTAGDVDVPDFSKPGVSLSGLVFGTATDIPPAVPPTHASPVPVEITSARSFAFGRHITALVRVYQGGTAPLAAVLLKTQIVDARNVAAFSDNGTLNADEFDAARSSDYRLDLATLHLKPGPQRLEIQALMANGSTAQCAAPFVIL